MKRLAVALSGACALALTSTAANATAVITVGTVAPIPGVNDFKPNLNSLGLWNYTDVGASITLTADSLLTFEFLGSESGFNDGFTAGSVSGSESTSWVNNFGSPVLLGSDWFSAGSLAGLLNFTSNFGIPAGIGSQGFGIFLPGRTDYTTNVFYLGYDDFGNGPDDNHDDYIVRVTVASVPEPGTWAMMLLGFGAMGFAVRRSRRKAAALAQLA